MDWIKLIKTDSNKTLQVIYTMYRKECVQWQMNMYNVNEEIAKDAFQLSIVILYENIVSEKIKFLTSDLKTYLFGIVKNKVREIIKKESKYLNEGKIGVIKSEIIDTVDEKEDIEILLNKVTQELSNMGDPCKSILKLFYFDQKSMQQIAHIVGHENPRTTKSKKYKCLKRLNKLVQNKLPKLNESK